MALETLGYSFLGGILPAMVWLYFLLKEDARCPEPRSLIALAFFSGAITVALVVPLERWSLANLPLGEPSPGAIVILAWATIEETLKYLLVALLVLWRRAVNESIDLVIYMLTAALGFAAAENVLFLLQPFANGQFAIAVAMENLRFIGATLLHVIASSAIGFALAFSYRKKRMVRAYYASAGLILAIALHALFNFLIIQEDGSHTLFAFFTVWTGAVVFFALFEILKYFRYHRLPKNTC